MGKRWQEPTGGGFLILPSLGQRYNYQLSDHFVNNKRGLEFKIIDIYYSKKVLSLAHGDTVNLKLYTGTLYDRTHRDYTMFSGVLVEDY